MTSRSLDWYLVTDLSVQLMGPIFRGRAVLVRRLKMKAISCAETSVTSYQSTLRNITEERKSHLYRDGSLMWRILFQYTKVCVLCHFVSCQLQGEFSEPPGSTQSHFIAQHNSKTLELNVLLTTVMSKLLSTFYETTLGMGDISILYIDRMK